MKDDTLQSNNIMVHHICYMEKPTFSALIKHIEKKSKV